MSITFCVEAHSEAEDDALASENAPTLNVHNTGGWTLLAVLGIEPDHYGTIDAADLLARIDAGPGGPIPEHPGLDYFVARSAEYGAKPRPHSGFGAWRGVGHDRDLARCTLRWRPVGERAVFAVIGPAYVLEVPMLLNGKRLVITGVRSSDSIAFAVARRAQEDGAEIVVTALPRVLDVAKDLANELPDPPEVLEFDATSPESVRQLSEELGRRWDRIDGALHAIAFAPRSCVGGDILNVPWSDVGVGIHTSTYSLKSLTEAVFPFMTSNGGSIVALDFDARVTWPGYNWMGVAKAGLESLARYLARDLGRYRIRVNLVSAGPLSSISAGAVEGFDEGQTRWSERAPLGWDGTDLAPTANACIALFSDLFPATTGEMIHVDGGAHFLGD
jgi:meromycolic acid enoyl-[acyl-carrier-protein] reductase